MQSSTSRSSTMLKKERKIHYSLAFPTGRWQSHSDTHGKQWYILLTRVVPQTLHTKLWATERQPYDWRRSYSTRERVATLNPHSGMLVAGLALRVFAHLLMRIDNFVFCSSTSSATFSPSQWLYFLKRMWRHTPPPCEKSALRKPHYIFRLGMVTITTGNLPRLVWRSRGISAMNETCLALGSAHAMAQRFAQSERETQPFASSKKRVRLWESYISDKEKPL